jgi:hypothetical protein
MKSVLLRPKFPTIEPRRSMREIVANDYEPDYKTYTLEEDLANLQEALSSL